MVIFILFQFHMWLISKFVSIKKSSYFKILLVGINVIITKHWFLFFIISQLLFLRITLKIEKKCYYLTYQNEIKAIKQKKITVLFYNTFPKHKMSV